MTCGVDHLYSDTKKFGLPLIASFATYPALSRRRADHA
jgi:hypothetical protein